MRHAHWCSGRDVVAGLCGWVGVDGWGEGGDAGASVGDGDADAEGFLDDGPEVWLLLEGREVVGGFSRSALLLVVREGGSEFLLQEP